MIDLIYRIYTSGNHFVVDTAIQEYLENYQRPVDREPEGLQHHNGEDKGVIIWLNERCWHMLFGKS